VRIAHQKTDQERPLTKLGIILREYTALEREGVWCALPTINYRDRAVQADCGGHGPPYEKWGSPAGGGVSRLAPCRARKRFPVNFLVL